MEFRTSPNPTTSQSLNRHHAITQNKEATGTRVIGRKFTGVKTYQIKTGRWCASTAAQNHKFAERFYNPSLNNIFSSNF